METPLKRVFLSYATPDRGFALKLADRLEERKIEVFIDVAGIPGGRSWAREIRKAIRKSDHLLLVVSPDSQESKYVNHELHAADRYGVPIIPLIHRNTKEIPILIDGLQHIDFREWDEEGFAKLLQYEAPRRSSWRRFVIFLKRNRLHLYFVAALIACGVAALYGPPSKTRIEASPDGPRGILVNVQNRGGRFSTVAGASFRIDFGELPIETQDLVLRDLGQSTRAWAHRNLPVRLKPEHLWVPKEIRPNCYYSKEDVSKLISEQAVRLIGTVTESDGSSPEVATPPIPANRIKDFILGAYPPHVHCEF